jgi:hypothetical protein
MDLRSLLFGAAALLLFRAGRSAALEPAPEPAPDPAIDEIGQAVDPGALHADIAAILGFGTRHTLSDTASPTRGVGAARRWSRGRLAIAAGGL